MNPMIVDAESPPRPQRDPPPNVLAVRDLSKRYPGTLALDRVTLDLAANEILGLAGHNGAGKSTLTHVLAGASKPDSGEIALDGKAVRFRSPDDAKRHGIAFVPQPLMIVPNLTGRENLLLGMDLRSGSSEQNRPWFADAPNARAAVDAMAEHLRLTRFLEVKAGRLRPVSQRLLMIGRAMLRSPRVIILDEPTANLSEPEVEALFSIVRPLARSTASVVYITHRLDEMLGLCSRVIVLRQGRVIAEKDARQINKRELGALIAGADLAAELTALVSGVNVHSSGRATESVAGQTAADAAAPLLRCEKLSSRPRTRDIDLVLHRGEVLGISGLDGSGRTSFLRTLWGDRPITGGRIIIRGKETPVTSPRKAIAAGMAYLPEERAANAVFPGMTVAANATLPWLRRFGALGVFPNTNSELSQVSGLLARLGVGPLKGAAHSKIRTFSGGNQQKVLIARWLMGAADIFLFDEPTQGIDVGAREQVYEVIRELAADGAGILIVSSEAEELARLCSRVHIMSNGAIVRTLAGDEVTETTISRATVESGTEIAS
jgi:ABC-type sugar transport system ATPase subunit